MLHLQVSAPGECATLIVGAAGHGRRPDMFFTWPPTIGSGPGNPNEIFAANVDGTRIVMQEAKKGRRRANRLYQQRRHPGALRDDGTAADETVRSS